MKKQIWYPSSKLASNQLTKQFTYQVGQALKDMLDIFFRANDKFHGFGLSILIKCVNQSSGYLLDNKSMALKVSELDALYFWVFGDDTPTLRGTVKPLIVNVEGGGFWTGWR